MKRLASSFNEIKIQLILDSYKITTLKTTATSIMFNCVILKGIKHHRALHRETLHVYLLKNRPYFFEWARKVHYFKRALSSAESFLSHQVGRLSFSNYEPDDIFVIILKFCYWVYSLAFVKGQ